MAGASTTAARAMIAYAVAVLAVATAADHIKRWWSYRER